MNKDQWQRIEKVFYSAMELAQPERDEFVRKACAGDEELHNEVWKLLTASHETEDFLESPASLPQNRGALSLTRVKYCPKCNQNYPTSLRFCSSDQEILSLKDPYHLVGRTLMDKYRIIALVGVGGMGAVYCAHHLGIDRRVAFKILQPNLAIGNDYVVGLFEREAKLAGRLSHENIVDVKDAGHTPDGIAYIAMEWLEGRTLDEELSSQGRFGFKRAIGIIKQITVALSEAHAKHVVHRDLKPGNIMLLDTPDGHDQVNVLDFGIGKIITETTGNSPVSALVGTPQYASPEQLTVGGQVDGRSDIYSLGVIFYRMLGGQLPFDCSSMGELLQMQLTVMPKSLRAIRPETPPVIEELINDMLAKEAAERPESAGELLKRLDHALRQVTIEELDSSEDTSQVADPVHLKGHESDQHTTEDILGIPSPLKSGSNARIQVRLRAEQASEAETVLSAPKSVRRSRSYLRYAMTIVALMLAGSYGLYRYRYNDSLDIHSVSGGQTRSGELKPPSPSQTEVSVTNSQPNLAGSTVATAETSSKQISTQASQPPPLPTAVNRVGIQANQQKAAEHLQRARELYQQGEYQRALRECNESLKLNPRQVDARQFQRKIKDVIRILNSR